MNYKKIYDQIIERAKFESRSKDHQIYYEAHHIIPRCMGGEGSVKNWRTHSNIILLTAKEHFICHLLLCEIYPNEKKLKYALWAMCNQKNYNQKDRYSPSSKLYNRIKIDAIELIRKNNSGSKGFNHSEKTIKIIKEKNKNKFVSNETKEKQRLSKIGTKRSQSAIEKHSNSVIGEKNPMYNKIRITNGIVNKTINKNDAIPEGFIKGMIKNKNK